MIQNTDKKVHHWFVILLVITICFNYFEIYNHHWFLKLLGGYVIKIWLLPVMLLFFIILKKLFTKDFSILSNLSNGITGITILDVLIFLYFAFGLFSLLLNEQPYNIGKYSLIMFAPLALYIAIIYVYKDNAGIEKIFKIMFGIGLIFSLLSFFYYNAILFNIWNPEAVKLKYMFSEVTHIREVNEAFCRGYIYLIEDTGNVRKIHSVARITLPFIDQPAFGAMLAPIVLIGLYYGMKSIGLLKFFYCGSSFFLFYIIINTAARSTFIALMMGLIPFLWHNKKKIKDILIVLTFFAVITGTNETLYYRFMQLGGYIVQKILVDKNIEKNIKVNIPDDGHIDSILTSFNEIFNEISSGNFWGNGISYLQQQYKDQWNAEHNRYLFIMLTSGILTAIPYIAFVLGLFVISRKTFLFKKKTANSVSDIGLILYPSVLLFAIQINNAGMERYYYWVFFGFAAAWIRNSRHKIKNENIAN